MIFQHTWEKVLSGEKVQTRRLVKLGDGFTTPLSMVLIGKDAGRVITTPPNRHLPSPDFNNIYSVCNGKRTVYQVGKDYAVQPGRTKPAIARIRITGIRREDVREIDLEDVVAEGFKYEGEFLYTWCSMHDPKGYSEYFKQRVYPQQPAVFLKSRPDNRYQAWALTFEVVK